MLNDHDRIISFPTIGQSSVAQLQNGMRGRRTTRSAQISRIPGPFIASAPTIGRPGREMSAPVVV
jgi:hypothetical protein